VIHSESLQYKDLLTDDAELNPLNEDSFSS
jgi:hypothetical protein